MYIIISLITRKLSVFDSFLQKCRVSVSTYFKQCKNDLNLTTKMEIIHYRAVYFTASAILDLCGRTNWVMCMILNTNYIPIYRPEEKKCFYIHLSYIGYCAGSRNIISFGKCGQYLISNNIQYNIILYIVL